jgi:Domain of unknown function (DUF4157)
MNAQKNPLTPAPHATLQRSCGCGGSCGSCQEKRLQRSPLHATGRETAPPIVHEVLRSSGAPLDGATRSSMESRFGHDFSSVRVHSDARAAASAQAVGARAYTVGDSIAFGAGRYAPHTRSGEQLLAHELAHTVQQRGAAARVDRLAIGVAGSPAEQEADAAADAVVAGGRAATLSTSPALIARAPGDGDDTKKKAAVKAESLRAQDEVAAADEIKAGVPEDEGA